MKISYKLLWKTLIDKNMSKRDLRLQAHLTTNHIANMGKGQHIPSLTLKGQLQTQLEYVRNLVEAIIYVTKGR